MNLSYLKDRERLYLIQKGVIKAKSPEDNRMRIMNMELYRDMNEMLEKEGKELFWAKSNGKEFMDTRNIE